MTTTTTLLGFDTIEINLVLHTNDFLLPPTETQCQQYLSFYWPNFDQSLKSQLNLSRQLLSWQHLSIIFILLREEPGIENNSTFSNTSKRLTPLRICIFTAPVVIKLPSVTVPEFSLVPQRHLGENHLAPAREPYKATTQEEGIPQASLCGHSHWQLDAPQRLDLENQTLSLC